MEKTNNRLKEIPITQCMHLLRIRFKNTILKYYDRDVSGSPVVKNLSIQGTQVQSLAWEDFTCLCLTVCSCSAFDVEAKRNSHVYYKEINGEIVSNRLVYKDKEYVLLSSESPYSLVDTFTGYVTTSDVPHLLAMTRGNYITIARNEKFIQVAYSQFVEDGIYVREDIVGEIDLKNVELSEFCFYYYRSRGFFRDDGSPLNGFVFPKDDFTTAVNTTLAGKKAALPYEKTYDYQHLISLYSTDKSGSFYTDAAVGMLIFEDEIYLFDGTDYYKANKSNESVLRKYIETEQYKNGTISY